MWTFDLEQSGYPLRSVSGPECEVYILQLVRLTENSNHSILNVH